MRLLPALCLLLLTAIDTSAQKLSAGLRAGAGYWYTSDESFGYHLRTAKGAHLSFVPEAFVRFAAGKKWAFEAAFNQAALSHSEIRPNWPEWKDTVAWTGRIRSNTWTLSAQYDLSCPGLRKCRLLKPLHSYLGITVGAEQQRYTSDMYPDSRSTGAFDFTVDAVRIWTGLSHTMTYDVGKSWMLLSNAYFSVRPTEMLAERPMLFYDHMVARFGGQLGVAYRF